MDYFLFIYFAVGLFFALLTFFDWKTITDNVLDHYRQAGKDEGFLKEINNYLNSPSVRFLTFVTNLATWPLTLMKAFGKINSQEGN